MSHNGQFGTDVSRLLLKIGPDEAKRLLGDQINNRHVAVSKVRLFAAEMKTGDFHSENGEPIILDKHGRLMDGQHRLHAVIQAGVTLPFAVVRGVPQSLMRTYGRGRARTVADVLGMQGRERAALLAAALGHLYVYTKSRMQTAAYALGYNATEAERLLGRHPNFIASVAFAGRHRTPPYPIRGSVLAFCHYVMAEKDSTLATQFLASVAEGVDVKLHSPAYVLRRYLARNESAGLSAVEEIAMTFKAWTALRSGRPLKILKWERYGERAQPFPALEAGEPSRGPVLHTNESRPARISALEYVRNALATTPAGLSRQRLIENGLEPPHNLSVKAIRYALKALKCLSVGRTMVRLPENAANAKQDPV